MLTRLIVSSTNGPTGIDFALNLTTLPICLSRSLQRSQILLLLIRDSQITYAEHDGHASNTATSFMNKLVDRPQTNLSLDAFYFAVQFRPRSLFLSNILHSQLPAYIL